jgi:hypothetical protein
MTMTRRRIIIASLVILLALLLWLGIWRSLREHAIISAPATDLVPSALAQSPTNAAPAPSPGAPLAGGQAVDEKRKRVVASILGSLATPITFYGKVVDQNGKLVPNVRVGYGLLDKFNASGSTGHQFADETGYFKITGVRGAVIGVTVSKNGYYQIHNVSNQNFAYGIGADSSTKPPPTRDNPAVFVLHKMGETEPLIQVSSRTYRIPRDGTPVGVNLETGQRSSTGHIRVEAWTTDQVKDAERHHDWRCRISVPGGGLVERKGQFDFEAPRDGYLPSDEIMMPHTAERWHPDAERDFFLKLPDERYARIKFRMIAQGDHFFEIESYLNPKVGSRNLEFDPAKVAKVGKR